MNILSPLADALGVLFPTECVACHRADRAVCDVCLPGLSLGRGGAVALRVRQAARPPLLVWSALAYDGVVKEALSAFKEHGRTDATRALARPLAEAVMAATLALGLPADAVLVPAPSSRAANRLRGYNPVSLLAERAGGGRSSVAALSVGRRVADQAGLGVAARQANLAGSVRLRTKVTAGFSCRDVLLIDDVVTTGATLLECRRALEHGGVRVRGAATLAFAERRAGVSAVERSADPGEHSG
ncbi:ComF family protein [Subtercola vilae]|uniref:ComF family protein n=1 Tax=Subtercola vilae TaxID=2056433 RepID=A0A4T2C5X1_9MICO|nr:ComF family protein [Subtercola vilae]TIH37836.1 ComF family protein [Subtercola vilae]